MKNNDEPAKLLRLEWRDEGRVQYSLTNIKYVEIGDMFVEVCSAKPTMSKTIWYSDTKEDPGSDYQAFRDMNQRLHMPKLITLTSDHFGLKQLYYVVTHSNDQSGGRLVTLTYDTADSRRTLIRKVTESELEVINRAIEEVRVNYTTRLGQ